MTTFGALLRLARISNLPTVWSNVLAAYVLAGGMEPSSLACVLLAMSALYTGGMVLNDAFDQAIDARERPERPLPSGEVSPAMAWFVGGGLLALGVAVLAGFGRESAIVGLVLAGAILVYDAWHKGNPASPLIMGACRALVYIGTAVAAGGALSESIAGAALALFLYVVGLTQAAKGRAFRSMPQSWPAVLLALPIFTALTTGQVSASAIVLAVVALCAIGWAIAWLASGAPDDREPAIALLVAAIALSDAVVAAAHGNTAIAAVCGAFFLLTLALQRRVNGT